MAKKLIYRMKFDGNREVARFIGEQINAVVPLIDFDMITYVPASPKRRRERSFDHTKLIAGVIATKRHIILKPLLVRTNNTRQLGSSRTARLRQAESAYKAIKGEKYTKVLLIDDVVSTGATIEACAKELRRAGHKEIYAASFARN